MKVFISYSHKDEKYKDGLITGLAALKREKKIVTWHDREIEAGENIDDEINANLNDCDIILLLISSDYIASDYCYKNELDLAIKRHNRGDAKVIPVIIRQCDWKTLPFGRLDALPLDGRAISSFRSKDDPYTQIALELRKIINKRLKMDDTLEGQKEKSFPLYKRNTVIVRLPRGFVEITDIDYREDSSWSTIASYYDYLGNHYRDTHFHSSYHDSWSEKGFNFQFKKLGIPYGDWDYADDVCLLMMDLREREKDESVKDILARNYPDSKFISYEEGKDDIAWPTLPNAFRIQNKIGIIADIIAQIQNNKGNESDLYELESLRRQAYIECFNLMKDDHPSMGFLKEEINKFSFELTDDEIERWKRILVDTIYDVKSEIEKRLRKELNL